MPLPPQRSYWDRECDQQGNTLRLDVREAAQRVWPLLFSLARKTLLDPDHDAPELMEKVVDTVSLFLDSRGTPQHEPDGLLTVSFRHELYRLSRKEKRLVSLETQMELGEWLQSAAPADDAEQAILVEEVVRLLQPRNRALLRLRNAGYDWRELSAMVNVPSSTLRNDFRRDVRRVYMRLTSVATPEEGEV